MRSYPLDELQVFYSFLLARLGSYEAFLIRDDTDHVTVGEVFDGACSPDRAQAVRDEGGRLVAQRETEEQCVDGVLQHGWDAVVVLGSNEQHGVRVADGGIPLLDQWL